MLNAITRTIIKFFFLFLVLFFKLLSLNVIFRKIVCNLQTAVLLNQICDDWNVLKDSEEIEIAKKYGKFMRLCAIVLVRKKSFKIFLFIDK